MDTGGEAVSLSLSFSLSFLGHSLRVTIPVILHRALTVHFSPAADGFSPVRLIVGKEAPDMDSTDHRYAYARTRVGVAV